MTVFTPSYENHTHHIHMKTDVNGQKSFEDLEFWYKQLQEHQPTCPIILVGTKTDMVRDQDTARDQDTVNDQDTVKDHEKSFKERGLSFAAEHKISSDDVFFTSTRRNEGVDEVFSAAARYGLEYARSLVETDTVDPTKSDAQSKWWQRVCTLL